MAAPIIYQDKFVSDPDAVFTILRDQLDWERREDVPRCEHYCNDDLSAPYTYGQGRGFRTYMPHAWHPALLEIRHKLEALTGAKFEVCVLNRYLNQSDSLNWHADDSEEIDDDRPIGIVSFGVEREIWFRPNQPEVPRVARTPIIPVCDVCCGVGDCADPNHPVREFNARKDKEWSEARAARNAQAILNDAAIEKVKLLHGSLCLMERGMQDTWQHRIPKASFQCGERISLTFRGYLSLK